MKHSRADVCGKASWVWKNRSAESHITRDSPTLFLPHWHQGTAVEMFPPQKANLIYGHHVMVMLPVVHLIIGHRRSARRGLLS